MPTNKIIKLDDTLGIGYGPNFAGIKVDTTDLTLQYNADGTVRTVVSTALTQTLTNKTLTSPTITTPTITGGTSTAKILVNTAISADGAVPVAAGFYDVTKAGVCAMTLAAPVAGDDGLEMTVSSNTAYAHTLTATGLFQCGTAAVNVCTFSAFAGASVTLVARNLKWRVKSANHVTFS